MPYLCFLGITMVKNMFNFKRSLPIRLVGSLSIGTLAIFSNHYVGQYGIYKNMDEIFKVVVSEKNLARGSKVANDAQLFLNQN